MKYELQIKKKPTLEAVKNSLKTAKIKLKVVGLKKFKKK